MASFISNRNGEKMFIYELKKSFFTIGSKMKTKSYILGEPYGGFEVVQHSIPYQVGLVDAANGLFFQFNALVTLKNIYKL